MNAAVAYLTLARGTGADNKTSCWSVDAIERYTGISRGRARAAIDDLKACGALRVLRDGTRPKYELMPAAEIPGLARPELSYLAKNAYERICGGGKIHKNADKDYIQEAVKAGWLKDLGNGEFAPVPASEIAADPIWLPNELVTSAAGETPPIELVRQTQDVMTLRLLIDFYGVHDLREDGGVPRQHTRKKYDRREAGRFAEFTVLAFREDVESVTWAGPTLCHRREKLTKEEKEAGMNAGVDFFRRQSQLAGLSLIEWRPHLVESEDPAAEIIHPYGMGGDDTGDIEDRLGAAAHRAGFAMLTEAQRQWVAKNNRWLAPVPAHMANVAMVGIARLRYRPHTRRTAAWFADRAAKAQSIIDHYEKLRRRAAGG